MEFFHRSRQKKNSKKYNKNKNETKKTHKNLKIKQKQHKNTFWFKSIVLCYFSFKIYVLSKFCLLGGWGAMYMCGADVTGRSVSHSTHRGWELNSSLLQEQHQHLTTELALQPWTTLPFIHILITSLLQKRHRESRDKNNDCQRDRILLTQGPKTPRLVNTGNLQVHRFSFPVIRGWRRMCVLSCSKATAPSVTAEVWAKGSRQRILLKDASFSDQLLCSNKSGLRKCERSTSFKMNQRKLPPLSKIHTN